MHNSRIFCVFVALGVLSGCSTAETGPYNTLEPSSATSSPLPTASSSAPAVAPTASSSADATQIITVDPWAEDAFASSAPTVLLNPSADNWCDVSRVTDRSDGYMCVYEPSQGHAPDALCISNPAAAEEYACLEPDLTWRIIRGLPFKGTERSSPHLQGDYVYLKLIDGTICADVSKSGMEPIGDYGFQGFCDDGTSYYARFSSSGTPADGASPFGEGTDEDGRWLVKTGSAISGQLTPRPVETAYR